MQSRVSDKKGVLSGDAHITQNLMDVDFSDEELAQVGLQKGVLGLPEPLGCVCSVLPSVASDNNNSGGIDINGSGQCNVIAVGNKGEDTREVRQSGRKQRQTNYTDDTVVGDSDDDLVAVEPQILDAFEEGA